ncbi:hypothetical protein M8J76_011891 [Diaphorina citri]|nr:hypothetical protein M8J76_011891 [Diaphorina citri]
MTLQMLLASQTTVIQTILLASQTISMVASHNSSDPQRENSELRSGTFVPRSKSFFRRSESFFPRGPARNTIRNLPPHEEEIRLVAKQEGRVRSLVDKWEKKGKTPASVDWRKQGALTPVRDQKYCAAQYAFAFAAMLEAQFFIRHGELPSLSVQQLIDCLNPENAVNYGCQGGHAMSTFYYLQIAGGLQSERDYPFEGKQGACRYVLGRDVVQVNDIFGLSGEKAMRHFIHRKGPVVAYVNPALMINDYTGGVISHDARACNPHPSHLTHMVVIVGYGQSRAGVPYWIVRNSWGPRWGYAGYAYVERGTNACGIEQVAILAAIE